VSLVLDSSVTLARIYTDEVTNAVEELRAAGRALGLTLLGG
jgi:hypothetical protein